MLFSGWPDPIMTGYVVIITGCYGESCSELSLIRELITTQDEENTSTTGSQLRQVGSKVRVEGSEVGGLQIGHRAIS